MDFLFIEFYIMKKYGQRVEEHFGVTRQSVSQWRSTNEVPEKRVLQFYKKEGSMDLTELFKSLYFDKN
jgi:hypothetical protein